MRQHFPFKAVLLYGSHAPMVDSCPVAKELVCDASVFFAVECCRRGGQLPLFVLRVKNLGLGFLVPEQHS